ncbi:MAG: dihydrofolate reductase [Bacteroidia bacterium]|jgi:dihydrofolate reductase
MAVRIIVAVASNGIIGKDNALIWNLPDDMRHFVRSTKGHPVIMGRKTFESMDGPLPKRTNIVITRNPDYSAEGIVVANSLTDAIKEAQKLDEDIYIIGGAEIYRLAESMCDIMHVTQVHDAFEGDSSFSIQKPEEWKKINGDFHEKDDRHNHTFTIEEYHRID